VEKAQSFIDRKEYDDANRQLDLALADAELAEAIAEAGNSQQANKELQLSIDLMKEEIARVQEQ
jgi:predicted negative regulator of RcsB-dependent stress response